MAEWTSDRIESLRKYLCSQWLGAWDSELEEAVAELDRLQSENSALKKALESIRFTAFVAMRDSEWDRERTNRLNEEHAIEQNRRFM